MNLWQYPWMDSNTFSRFKSYRSPSKIKYTLASNFIEFRIKNFIKVSLKLQLKNGIVSHKKYADFLQK